MNGLTGIIMAGLMTAVLAIVGWDLSKTVNIGERMAALEAKMTLVLSYIQPERNFD
jgi:hypothetical protein